MSTQITAPDPVLIGLLKEYFINPDSAGGFYGPSSINLGKIDTMKYGSFVGSAERVLLKGLESLTLSSPACIAAPKVYMSAKKWIHIGMDQDSSLFPVRLYVPEALRISTKRLSIGDVKMLAMPKTTEILCEKLILRKHQEEDPDYFEIVKSWLVDEDTEVEVRQV